MSNYEEKKFAIPNLKGLSEKQLTVHIGLYAGYVKHVNLLREKIHEFETEDKEKHAYMIAELRRRFGFEFDGMRMHEYYFEQFEGGFIEKKEKNHLVTYGCKIVFRCSGSDGCSSLVNMNKRVIIGDIYSNSYF